MAIYKIIYDNHALNKQSATSNFRIALGNILTAFPNCCYAEVSDSQHDIFVTATRSYRTHIPDAPIEVLVFNGTATPTSSYYEEYNSAFANAIYALMIPETPFVKVFYPLPATDKVVEITLCSYSRHVYEDN